MTPISKYEWSQVPEKEALFFEYDAGKAVKISIPRFYAQRDLDDGDAYGG